MKHPHDGMYQLVLVLLQVSRGQAGAGCEAGAGQAELHLHRGLRHQGVLRPGLLPRHRGLQPRHQRAVLALG